LWSLGGFVSLFCCFIYYVNTLPPPLFPTDWPNAVRAAKLATNHRTPYNVFDAKQTKIGKLPTPHNALTGCTYPNSQHIQRTTQWEWAKRDERAKGNAPKENVHNKGNAAIVSWWRWALCLVAMS
jgi:hypothetical protein